MPWGKTIYKYYYHPTEDKGIYIHVKHEIINYPIPISEGKGIDLFYVALTSECIKSSGINDLNFGRIPPYLHIYNEEEREAFKKSDERLAKEILGKYTPIKRECDRVLSELFEEELSTNEAVVTAMLTRYFKRINSHVSNIASGLVYPLNEIDFVTGDILE